jgi:hypothetical protein
MPVNCPNCNHLLDSVELRQRWAFRFNTEDGTWQWKLLEASHDCTHCGKTIDNQFLKEAGLTGISNPLVWYGESSPWRKLRIPDKTRKTRRRKP